MSDEELVDWIRESTGAVELQIERRSGGASREGYAVDVHTADAVFWGESSIEKFVVPYYASVYGSDAGDAVTELLDTYNGVAAGGSGGDGGETLEPTTVEVYGLVHMPRSEYIELDDPPARQARPARHDRFAVLALDRATGAHRVIAVEEYRKRRGGS